MKKFILILSLLALIGMAGAQQNFGPPSGIKVQAIEVAGTSTLTGAVTAPAGITGPITGDITGTASRIAVGTFIDTAYALKNSTANKAQVNITADKGLEFGTGAALGALQVEAGNGIKLSSAGVAVEPTDIIDTSYGLLDNSDDIRVNLTADDGLEFGTGATLGSLGVKTGDGLDTGATGVLVDATDIINTANGLYESSENNIAVNLTDNDGLGFGTGSELGALVLVPSSGIKNTLSGVEVNYTSTKGLAIGTGADEGALYVNITADKGLEFGTGAAEGSLQIELDGYSLSAGASGLKLNASDAQEVDTIAVNDADGLTVNGQIVPVYETLVFPIGASSVDEYVFVADDLWYLVKVEEIHVAAGTEVAPIAANLTIRICDDGEAVTGGINSTITPIPLDSAANTFNTASLNSSNVAIQNGDMIAFDYAGTLTGLRGAVTMTLRRM